MRPLGNYIFVTPPESGEKKTASGIIYELPNSEEKEETPTLSGKILAVGNAVNKKMRRGEIINTGATVHYFKDAGMHYDDIVIIHKNAIAHID